MSRGATEPLQAPVLPGLLTPQALTLEARPRPATRAPLAPAAPRVAVREAAVLRQLALPMVARHRAVQAMAAQATAARRMAVPEWAAPHMAVPEWAAPRTAVWQAAAPERAAARQTP